MQRKRKIVRVRTKMIEVELVIISIDADSGYDSGYDSEGIRYELKIVAIIMIVMLDFPAKILLYDM